jgi:hypothetical protein
MLFCLCKLGKGGCQSINVGVGFYVRYQYFFCGDRILYKYLYLTSNYLLCINKELETFVIWDRKNPFREANLM